MLAIPEDGGITVVGSLQCPYYVHRALAVLLGLPERQGARGAGRNRRRIRRQGRVPVDDRRPRGLLALKSGRPVKLVYDRVEDMLATTKRHPSVVRHRTGVTRDGRLTAMDIDVLMDGGAYCTLSPVVLSRGCLHATGPYRCDHVRVDGRVVMTNTPPNGAFRGFGAPQTLFAVEAHMDRIAEALGMDPARLREINALRPGDTTATGQVLGRDAAAREVLRAAVARSGFRRKRRRGPRHEPRHRPVAVLPRRGLHRQRRGEAAVEGLAGTHRRRASASSSPAPTSARASAPRTRRSSPTRSASPTTRRGGRRRHGAGARQRAHGRLAHDDGGRRAAEAVRGRDAQATGPADAGGLPPRARPARRHEAVRAAARPGLGRRDVSRVGLRLVRMGLRRHRGRARSGDGGNTADQGDDGPGGRQGDLPARRARARSRAARRRASATRSPRKSSCATARWRTRS